MDKHQIYKSVFNRFDEDEDGKISASELQRCMSTFGSQSSISLLEAEVALEAMDADGDGLLGLEDFVRFAEEGTGGSDEELREAFKMYAMEEEKKSEYYVNECITPRSLKRMLSKLGYGGKSVEECKVMISCFDIDGDGVISFDEFRVMMQ